jgi:peptide/nickel transport system substrate-binding protein
MSSRRTFLVNSVRLAGGLALAAACAPVAPAPSAQSAPAAGGPKRGGTLMIADRFDPQSIDPAFSGNIDARRILRAIFDPLVDVDPQGKVIPVLAESWDTPDPRTFVLHLRQGVKFHDGTPFNAEAVKFHFDRHLDPKTASRRNAELLSVAGADIVDANTVRVRLKAPYSAFMALLFDWSGFIVSPTAVQKLGNDFNVKPVGTGPFKIVEYQQGQQTTVERNSDYWMKDRPYLDRVVFRQIPADATRLVELQSGGVQLAEDLPFQDVDRVRAMKELVLSEKAGARFYYPTWNADSAYGKSVEFRRALNWILDREGIFKSVFFGTGAIGYDPFIPGSPFFDPDYKPFKRDLTMAKQLLDKANVPTPAKFTIYNPGDPESQKLFQILQANYAEVGVTIDLQVEQGAAAQARNDRGDWTFQWYSNVWWGYRPDPAQYIATIWHSQSQYQKTGKLKDPELDRLIEQGEGEPDPTKRKQIYRQLAARLNDLAPTIFFLYGADLKGMSPKLKGFVHYGDTITRYKDVWLE